MHSVVTSFFSLLFFIFISSTLSFCGSRYRPRLLLFGSHTRAFYTPRARTRTRAHVRVLSTDLAQTSKARIVGHISFFLPSCPCSLGLSQSSHGSAWACERAQTKERWRSKNKTVKKNLTGSQQQCRHSYIWQECCCAPPGKWSKDIFRSLPPYFSGLPPQQLIPLVI